MSRSLSCSASRGALVMLFAGITLFLFSHFMPGTAAEEIVRLPEPRYDGDVSIEKTLLLRRSVRSYKDSPLTLGEISQILWAAQGITHERGLRTAPSAGALYALEVYLVAGNVKGLESGLYRYRPDGHVLVSIRNGDIRSRLKDATLRQNYVGDAPASLVFFAVYERISKKYGDRGVRYSHMEAGHAAQNVYLQGVALGIDTVVVGAFEDAAVKELISPGTDEAPLYIMPLGKHAQ